MPFSPSYVEAAHHVVQHHPQPQPQVLSQRPLTLSPSRHPRHSGNRILVNHLPTQPLPHLPNSPLPILSPSPAQQLLHTSVNSPSLIPQNIPSGLMPRLPLQLPGRQQLLPRNDNNILPPHAFRRLSKPPPHQQDDDIEVTDNHHPPRRSLMSPKHNRRNFFNNLALQDHNYCAAPPASPHYRLKQSIDEAG